MLSRTALIRRLLFWVASVAASAYWLLLAWRVEGALLWVFLGLESWIVGLGALGLIRASIFYEAGTAAFAVALIGLAAGSAISWGLLRVNTSRPADAVQSAGESSKRVERTQRAVL